MDINSTLNSTSGVFNCFEEIHVGMMEMCFALLLCFFVGTPAQSWLLWLSFHDGWKIKPTQVFPLNLLILELIFCSQCAAQFLNVLIFNNGTLWKLIYIIFGVSWTGRPLTQICICVEQYLAVLHPVLFLKYKSVQYRVVLAAVVWLMAAACTACKIISDALINPVIGIVFVIAVAVISFCCVSVLRALKLPRPGDTTERGRDVGNQQKRNAFNKIFTGLLIILFSYFPQILLGLISIIKLDEELFYCDITPVMSSFNAFSVMVIPLLKMYKEMPKLSKVN